MPPPYATESANNGPTIMEGSTYHDATVRSTGLPAWNRDPGEIKTDRPAGSAGAQSAIGRKPAEERVFRPTLLHLADRIGPPRAIIQAVAVRDADHLGNDPTLLADQV